MHLSLIAISLSHSTAIYLYLSLPSYLCIFTTFYLPFSSFFICSFLWLLFTLDINLFQPLLFLSQSLYICIYLSLTTPISLFFLYLNFFYHFPLPSLVFLYLQYLSISLFYQCPSISFYLFFYISCYLSVSVSPPLFLTLSLCPSPSLSTLN